MKKIITLILSISIISVLCLSLCSCGQKASPIEDFEYELKDGEATITGYTGTDLEIVVPDTIEGRPVTVIGEKAFSKYDMTSIVLPDTVTEIEEDAFEYCKLLNKIDIPDSVTKIGGSAFENCENMREVNLGKGLEFISGYTFRYCKLLEKIDIPDSVTEIYDYAFYGCENMKEVNLGKGLKIISSHVFIDCDSLKSIHIPENVKFMDDVGFGRTTNGNSDFTIYGKSGTVAERYAKSEGLTFVAE